MAEPGWGGGGEADGKRQMVVVGVGVDFIRLVPDTTYCIGHKSSYPPNLSFKQIIQGGDASAVSLASRGLG